MRRPAQGIALGDTPNKDVSYNLTSLAQSRLSVHARMCACHTCMCAAFFPPVVPRLDPPIVSTMDAPLLDSLTRYIKEPHTINYRDTMTGRIDTHTHTHS